MTLQFLDSHCHLDPRAFGDEHGVDAVVARAREAGVARMVAVGSGYGGDSLRTALAVARRHPDIRAALGVHPHDAKEWTDALAVELEEMATDPLVGAIGECGLDFHYDHSPRDVQRSVLRAQIRIAQRVGLPIVIHDRESAGETLAILLEEGAFSGRRVVFHCFTGTVADMEAVLASGGFVSLSGIVTFKKAGELRDVAAAVPLDRLMIETDSPFLAPVPFRGRTNEPAHVPLVAAAVADARAVRVDEVAAATWQNASRFFGFG